MNNIFKDAYFGKAYKTTKRIFKAIYKSVIDICKFIIVLVFISLISGIIGKLMLELIKEFPIIAVVFAVIWVIFLLYILYDIIKYHYDNES